MKPCTNTANQCRQVSLSRPPVIIVRLSACHTSGCRQHLNGSKLDARRMPSPLPDSMIYSTRNTDPQSKKFRDRSSPSIDSMRNHSQLCNNFAKLHLLNLASRCFLTSKPSIPRTQLPRKRNPEGAHRQIINNFYPLRACKPWQLILHMLFQLSSKLVAFAAPSLLAFRLENHKSHRPFSPSRMGSSNNRNFKNVRMCGEFCEGGSGEISSNIHTLTVYLVRWPG